MILVTGATGTVGSEVVKRLAAQGIPVRAVTRDPRKIDSYELPHVHFVQGDFEDVDSMRRACAGVDRAFLATKPTERTCLDVRRDGGLPIEGGWPYGLLEEFAMYRRGEAAEVESGVYEALGRRPRSFGEFARDHASLFC